NFRFAEIETTLMLRLCQDSEPMEQRGPSGITYYTDILIRLMTSNMSVFETRKDTQVLALQGSSSAAPEMDQLLVTRTSHFLDFSKVQPGSETLS
ncbi:hypothetical protein STEG23_006101, partial [Scotinomys teguina]